MSLFASSLLFLLPIVAGVLMVLAGVGKKGLLWREPECPVCHHPRSLCTCRWL